MSRYTLREARETDAASIRELIHLVGINPLGLDWERFVVAVDEQDKMIGCGQLKPHGQKVLELASIAVYPEFQGKGIARLILEHLLKNSPRPLYLMCQSSLGPFYEKFGFQAISYEEMPRYFQRMSRLAGLATSLGGWEMHLLVMRLG